MNTRQKSESICRSKKDTIFDDRQVRLIQSTTKYTLLGSISIVMTVTLLTIVVSNFRSREHKAHHQYDENDVRSRKN